MNDNTLRRTLLFMPGDSLRKIRKATQLATDSIILDLEDGVALNRKDVARQTIVEALNELDFGRRERLIRINPPGTKWATADLQATIDARPNGYVLPKVETAEQIRSVSRFLAQAEECRGWPRASIRLLALIETARGVMELGAIAQADERLVALLFGAEDLAGDVGAQRTAEGWEVFYARSAVVTAAAAYGLQAIDTVFVDLNDDQQLAAECTFVRRMGYTGKLAIHPRQLAAINRTFSPSVAEIDQALRLIEAHTAHQASGQGAFVLDGKMVDRPVVRRAERVIEQARAAGLLSGET